MRGTAERIRIVPLLVLLIAELICGDASNVLNREDPCIVLCREKTHIIMQEIGLFKTSCCQRGCRFFNLVDLRYGWESNNLNGTRLACDASCAEAYKDPLDHYICYLGCGFMAKQRVVDLLALFSISMCMKEDMESNILSNILLPDVSENDMTDPGLRKELLPEWWDCNGFKLPQTYIKTVPMDANEIMGDSIFFDYSAEKEKANPKRQHCLHRLFSHDWSRSAVVSSIIFIILLGGATFFAFCCLLKEVFNCFHMGATTMTLTTIKRNDSSITSNISLETFYTSDETLFHSLEVSTQVQS